MKIYYLLLLTLTFFIYGQSKAFSRPNVFCSSQEYINDLIIPSPDENILLSDEEKQVVLAHADKVDSSIKKEFKQLLDQWNVAIKNHPETLLSSDTQSYTTLPEFDALKAMGKGIIPLIMVELLDEQNFYILQLYDALQDNSALKVTGDALEYTAGEQSRAKKVIKLWVDSTH